MSKAPPIPDLSPQFAGLASPDAQVALTSVTALLTADIRGFPKVNRAMASPHACTEFTDACHAGSACASLPLDTACMALCQAQTSGYLSRSKTRWAGGRASPALMAWPNRTQCTHALAHAPPTPRVHARVHCTCTLQETLRCLHCAPHALHSRGMRKSVMISGPALCTLWSHMSIMHLLALCMRRGPRPSSRPTCCPMHHKLLCCVHCVPTCIHHALFVSV
jgi:hypothetical protein